MKEPEHLDENDPLLEGLGLPADAWRLPRAPEGLREEVLARTSAAVRNRSRWRKILVGGVIAAAYAAGLATAVLVLGGAPIRQDTSPTVSEAAPSEALPKPPPPQPVAAPDPEREPEEFAVLLARSSSEQQMKLLKIAGDRYLNEYGDARLAMNYYRRLLALAPPEMQPTLDDTWLLRSLKQARLQEESHENANS
jgi:hypothetical protein